MLLIVSRAPGRVFLKQVVPHELLKIIAGFNDTHKNIEGEAQRQNDPLEFWEWILEQLRDTGNTQHPLLCDAMTVGRTVSVKFCSTCQGGWGDDDEFVKKDTDDFQKFHLTVMHPSPNCTLQECLNHRFRELASEPGLFATGAYYHSCEFPQPSEQTRLAQIDNREDQVLVVQLSPQAENANGSFELLKSAQVARAELEVDLTHCFDSPEAPLFSDECTVIVGELTGYIARRDSVANLRQLGFGDSADAVENELFKQRGATRGHFVSVTKSSQTGEFWLSDDLDLKGPFALGKNPDERWPPPLILFFTIKHKKRSENQDKLVTPTQRKEKEPIDLMHSSSDSEQSEEIDKEFDATTGKFEKHSTDALKDSLSDANVTPFFPKLTKQDVKKADELRANGMDEKSSCLFGENFSAAPMFKRINGEEELDLNAPLVEEVCLGQDWSKRGPGSSSNSYPPTQRNFVTLRNDKLVSDEIMTCFVNAFNHTEFTKKQQDPSHRPWHAFVTFFIDGLVQAHVTTGPKEKYSPTEGDNFTRKRRRPQHEDNQNPRTQKGAIHIFECERLVCPYNEDKIHFAFFLVDPNTLQQWFYDSFQTGIGAKEERIWKSKCLHRWVKHQHQLRLGRPHPLENVDWSADLVTDDHSLLGNLHQRNTLDCALHTSALPALLVGGKPASTLYGSRGSAETAGIEMRRRMALTIATGEFWFHTSEASDSDAKNRGDDSEPKKGSRDEETTSVGGSGKGVVTTKDSAEEGMANESELNESLHHKKRKADSDNKSSEEALKLLMNHMKITQKELLEKKREEKKNKDQTEKKKRKSNK